MPMSKASWHKLLHFILLVSRFRLTSPLAYFILPCRRFELPGGLEATSARSFAYTSFDFISQKKNLVLFCLSYWTVYDGTNKVDLLAAVR